MPLVRTTSTAILFDRFLVRQSAHVSESPSTSAIQRQSVRASREVKKMGSVSTNCLINLALDLSSSWKKLARALKLEDEVERISEDNRRNVSEQAYRMLLIWKQRNGSLATLQVLAEALKKPTVLRKDLAQKYCGNDNTDSSKTGKRFRKSSLCINLGRNSLKECMKKTRNSVVQQYTYM